MGSSFGSPAKAVVIEEKKNMIDKVEVGSGSTAVFTGGLLMNLEQGPLRLMDLAVGGRKPLLNFHDDEEA